MRESMARGRVIINTGDGKGKTTAAFGTALRAAGHGQQIAIVQFIKGSWNYGEAKALETFPNIVLRRIGSGFTWESDDPAVPLALAREAWDLSCELALSDRYDLLVLDELNYAIGAGLVAPEEVVDLLGRKPQRLSVIITGRDAPQALIDVADTVTEMRCIKHAFVGGSPAKKGIEY
jgi:cob(I)alamin adenosyltransferase